MAKPGDPVEVRRCPHGWATSAPKGTPCKHPVGEELQKVIRERELEAQRANPDAQYPPDVKRKINRAIYQYQCGAITMSQMMWEIDIACGRKTPGQIRAYMLRQQEQFAKVKDARGGGGRGPFAASGRTRKPGSHRDKTGHD